MTRTRPLTGIRVLELGGYISAPYATSILASLGAEVVKVEPPVTGDPFRRGMDAGSPYFVQYNAGKKSLAVNLKHPGGVALVKSLIPQFDVVVENSRPGKMASLGLGVEDVHRIAPSAVYASVSGFGDGGPWRDRAAYDSIGQSVSGIYSIMNDAGTPRMTGTSLADLVTGMTAAMGILASLVGRGSDPERVGTDLRTSLFEATSMITIDAMTQMFESGETPTRESRLPQGNSFCVKTADGGTITVHLSSSQEFWLSLTRAMDRPDLAEDPRFLDYNKRVENYFSLRSIVEQAFLTRDRADWERRLVEFDVPFAPVLTLREVSSHPQAQWLQLIEPERDGLSLVRPPWRFGGERADRTAAAPRVGQHSHEIARSVLSKADVDRLVCNRVIMCPASTTTAPAVP